VPYITRALPRFEALAEEGLSLIENNAETILEEIGLIFREDPEALHLWKAAGADVDGERVRFPRGLCRALVHRTAPHEFIQHARNPARKNPRPEQTQVLSFACTPSASSTWES
jgi:trimethylamine--corrinoid protein Co-methyltransferase